MLMHAQGEVVSSLPSEFFFFFARIRSNAQSDVCGTAPLNTRNTKIVGGEDAPAGAWPWQVSLHTAAHFCGGSLINDQWVLSAAHCLLRNGQPLSTSSLTIFLGRETQQLPNNNEESRRVSQIIIHPDYNSTTSDNDVSLLQLSSPVNFTNFIRPVCLASDGSVFNAGTTCFVTGWGTIRVGVPLPSPQRLQEVSVPIVSSSQCNTSYGGRITSNMICAGLEEGGKDSCQGDSGGPLVFQISSRWVQVGVVSFGIGCAQPNFPGVYARVSRFESWINRQIANSQNASSQPGFINPNEGATSGSARLVSLSVLVLLSVYCLSVL